MSTVEAVLEPAGSTRTSASRSKAAETALNLRVGEWVEVRSAEEIIATLDDDCSLDGLPFMPEMLQYCGRRFRVFKSAHKTCDTIDSYAIRRVRNAVHLDLLRCDGEAHGGCQAGCLLFWKDAWLKRAQGDHPGGLRSNTESPLAHEQLRKATRVNSRQEDEPRFRCQATDLLKYSTNVPRRERWDPRFYLKDLTSGNVKILDFVRFGLQSMLNAFMLRWFGVRHPRICGVAKGPVTAKELNLQPGELVRVRSKTDIVETLNAQQRNKGLWFDVEMVPYCESGPHKVLRRVDKIVDEKTGKLINLRNPCLILDGVTCSGKRSSDRMFCPRSIYPYWRELWLERVGDERAQ
jgi:hypothetical protein